MMQDIPPIANDTTTDPGIPFGIELDIWQIGAIIVGLIALLIFAYWMYNKTKGISGADVRVKIEDMMYTTSSPTRMMQYQMIFMFPAIFGLIMGLQMMWINFTLGLIMVCLISLGISAPYYYIKEKTREKKRNRYKLSGYLWKKDGKRIKYDFSNVSFGTEVMLSKAEMDLINDENEGWKKNKVLEDIKVFPTLIDDKYLIYILSKRPISEAFEWVDDEDFDYFGTIVIRADGPELREVATLHRVRDNTDDPDYKVNEYIPTLFMMWDASKSKECLQEIMPTDVTSDDVLAGLLKQMGAERRYTAGELNSKESALRSKNKGQSLMDDLGESLGRKKAMELRKNESRLTDFNIMTNPSLWYLLLGLGFAIVVAIVSYNSGWANAILTLTGAG